VDRFLTELEEECAGLRVIVVCHGNIIEGFRLILEGLTQSNWITLRDSSDPHDKIHNCQIFWYSRRDPHTRRMRSNIKYYKSICPWDLSKSSNQWHSISPPVFSNDDLLARVNSIPQLVNNDPEKDLRGSKSPEDDIESYQTIPT